MRNFERPGSSAPTLRCHFVYLEYHVDYAIALEEDFNYKDIDWMRRRLFERVGEVGERIRIRLLREAHGEDWRLFDDGVQWIDRLRPDEYHMIADMLGLYRMSNLMGWSEMRSEMMAKRQTAGE